MPFVIVFSAKGMPNAAQIQAINRIDDLSAWQIIPARRAIPYVCLT
jgi:hypothetical protein